MLPLDTGRPLGLVGVSDSQPPEHAEVRLCSTPYGEGVVEVGTPTKHVLADEGSYFYFSSAADSTAIQYTNAGVGMVPNGYFVTNALFWITNISPAPRRLFLDYLKVVYLGLTQAVSPDLSNAVTSFQGAIILDNVPRTPRNVTDTYAIDVPVNVNGDQAGGSNAQLIHLINGQISNPGPTARVVSRLQFKGGSGAGSNVMFCQNDEFSVIFGAVDGPPAGGYFSAAYTTPGSYVTRAPPVVLGPGQCAILNVWFPGAPGSSAGSFKHRFELGWWER